MSFISDKEPPHTHRSLVWWGNTAASRSLDYLTLEYKGWYLSRNVRLRCDISKKREDLKIICFYLTLHLHCPSYKFFYFTALMTPVEKYTSWSFSVMQLFPNYPLTFFPLCTINPHSIVFSQRWILEEAMGLEDDSCLPSVMRIFPAPSTYLKIINYLEQIQQKKTQ